MKLCIIFVLIGISCNLSFAQQKNLDSLDNSLEQRPSVGAPEQELDSINKSFYYRSDSLKKACQATFEKIDSVQSGLKIKVRKLQEASVQTQISKIDSLQPSNIAHRIDSLSTRLKSNEISRALDSINHLRVAELNRLNSSIEDLKVKTMGKLNSLDLPPSANEKLTNVMANVSGFKIPASDLNLLQSQLNTNLTMPNIGNLSVPSIPSGLENIGGLENLNSNVAAVPDIAGKTGAYGNDIKQITSVKDVNELSKVAETKAGELSGMSEIKEQTQALDQYKEMAGSIQNPDSMKLALKQEIRTTAVNHFAGREEQLKQAMETIAKYKNKYSSLNSLADIKKRPPNEMKGKPWRERIVPGFALQIQRRGDNFMVDFNAYAGYRFTGRLTAGGGWNQRVAYRLDSRQFNSDARVFGPRIFGEFKLWKGFSPRLEGEVMNSTVPPSTITSSLDPTKREWIWGAFIGLKKEYRFFKNIRGTALVMTRLFNPDHKSPYADVLNVRFGFEFPMKKKEK